MDSTRIALSLALALGASTAWSATMFDFTTLGANNTPLAQNVTVGGVRADAYKYIGGSATAAGGTWSTQNTTLWLRNVTNDHGLGICSETNCSTGGGDVNEISSLTNLEVLRLTRPDGQRWTSLWLSSLDANGGVNDVEDGTLYWSNTALPNLATASFKTFTFPGFFNSTAVEGDLFAVAGFLTPAIESAKYLFFKPGRPGEDDDNNDFLVWKGAIDTARPPDQVPEPSTYLLTLAGLGMMGVMARSRTRS